MISFKLKNIYLITCICFCFSCVKPREVWQDALIRFGVGGAVNVAVGFLEDYERQQRYVQQQKIHNRPTLNNPTRLDIRDFQVDSGAQKREKVETESSGKITFADVIGQKNAVVEVGEVIDFLKKPERFERLGAKIPTGILLEGPPGTGKTLLARAIASEAGCNFFYKSGADFDRMYVGTGAQAIDDLFSQAKKSKPAIVFIDEIDAIGSVSRGIDAHSGHRQTLNKLLTAMDGFESDSSVIVIAATNNARALDRALKRPGRFTRIIRVDLPDEQGRREILQYYVGKLPRVEKGFSVRDFAQKTAGCSGADLANLVNEATMFAVRENAQCVGLKHFENALIKIRNRDR
jgi:cell division protease FtsH